MTNRSEAESPATLRFCGARVPARISHTLRHVAIDVIDGCRKKFTSLISRPRQTQIIRTNRTRATLRALSVEKSASARISAATAPVAQVAEHPSSCARDLRLLIFGPALSAAVRSLCPLCLRALCVEFALSWDACVSGQVCTTRARNSRRMRTYTKRGEGWPMK